MGPCLARSCRRHSSISGPNAPAGQESNWVQTWPGKSWQVIVRLYSPLPPWFDKTWKRGDPEPVNEVYDQSLKPDDVVKLT